MILGLQAHGKKKCRDKAGGSGAEEGQGGGAGVQCVQLHPQPGIIRMMTIM